MNLKLYRNGEFKMGYSKEEMETVLTFNYADGEWDVYSSVPKHIRKLMSIGDFIILEHENDRPIAIRGCLKEKQVSMKKERVLTEEQRQKAVERAEKMRKRKLNKD